MSDPRIVTPQVAQLVEDYVYTELSDAEKYDNREPLDESAIWSLHALAARIYAHGYEDGGRIEAERARREQQRERDRATKAVTDA